MDGDGYGDLASPYVHCGVSTKPGYSEVDGDCDDADATLSPAETDVCGDGLDNDCSGSEYLGPIWFADSDSDGFGDATNTQQACTVPSGYLSDDTDCDDADALISPVGLEICDGLDNDCDGSIDDADASVDLSTGETFYADADGDGYGDLANSTIACDVPSGFVTDDADCDDGDASISPSASEICDAIDNDCDGDIDDADTSVDTSTGSTFYADADGDGFGDSSSSASFCAEPAGYTTDTTDCDDTAGWIYPGAAEVCDGEDSDCDASTDEYGLVSYQDSSGNWSDVSSDFSSSTATTNTYRGGELNFCAESTGYATYYGNINLFGAITLQGLGGDVTLDGSQNAGSVLDVYSYSAGATIRDLTITGGNADQGSGIFCKYSTLELDGVSVDDNENNSPSSWYPSFSNNNGGGIWADQCQISMVDSEVSNNDAYPEAGGIYMYYGSLDLDNTDIWNNGSGGPVPYQSTDYGGHGILLVGTTATMSNGSKIRSNYGSGWGSLRITSSGSMTCTDSSIWYNGFDGTDAYDYTTGDGGVHLTRGTFTGNNCSMGESSSGGGENYGFDVVVGRLLSGGIHSYGNNENFSCAFGSGLSNTCS